MSIESIGITLTKEPVKKRPTVVRRALVPCCGGCLIVVVVIVSFFILSAPNYYFIPSASMEPTLHGGEKAVADRVITSYWPYRMHAPERGDIIVFTGPPKADSQSLSKGQDPVENLMIKRIIGIPGDSIQIKPAPSARRQEPTIFAVFRNGAQIVEPYIKEPIERPMSQALYGIDKPLKLGPNQYFIMGDNRNDSNDSQYWGPLEKRRIIGIVVSAVTVDGRERKLH